MSTDSNDKHGGRPGGTETLDEWFVFERDENRPMTDSLIEALDSVMDERIDESEPLEDYVDTDAINALFRPHGNRKEGPVPSVWFRFGEYDIVLQNDEEIHIYGPN